MTEYVYSLVYTIIYVVLWNMFVDIFVTKKSVNAYAFCLGQAVLVVSNYSIAFCFNDYILFKQMGVVIVNAVIICFWYVLKVGKAFVLAILFQGCSLAVEYLSYVILLNAFGERVETLTNSDVFCFLMGLLCQMLMFCLISLIRKSLAKKLGYLLSETEWLRFSIFPLFCIITIMSLMFNFEFVQDSKQGVILVWIVSGLVIMNILVFGLLSDALKRESELADYKVIQERGKNDTEMYQSMIENYNEQRKLVHEFKNHMVCVASLIQQEEYDKLNSYVYQIQETVVHEYNLIDTKNTLINIILNEKYIEACDKNILLSIKANDLSEIAVDDQDMVIVLANLLNNAIEACERCKEKVVKLKIVKEHKWLVISITNQYEQEPIKIADKYVTSKADNIQSHGVGIENIKDVVEKYNGSYAIKSENNVFQFSVLIPV